ncbi:DUF3667 domain-containing protein [Dokdonella sp. MW10]|uniref:DUF3667 domain-containing protein n=1 Tax=Dokdonella sp. MW10 TaxID=2992926 RepID=UPI003F7F04F5
MTIGIDLPPPPPPPSGGAIATPAARPDATFEAPPPRACPNCGAPIQGPYCYACGQSEKGMIRHLSAVTSDLADIVFNVDSRIFRSLRDVYFRPGFMTTEYIAGRRARYVTPFRLFFFLCVFSFLAMQMSMDMPAADRAMAGSNFDIDTAPTPEEVKRQVDEALALVNIKRKEKAGDVAQIAKLEGREAALRERADERLKELAEAQAKGETGPVPSKHNNITMFDVNGKPWDAETNPLVVGWLPDALNAKLNEAIGRTKENLRAGMKQPSRLLAGFMSLLPQTLFVMMPLFAVLLKLTYLFKRRLYMEHLLVALHSHAFIFLSLLVLLVLAWIGSWAGPGSVTAGVTGILSAAAWIWLFVSLFITQKRVYRQGWFFTTVKYVWVGVCYTIMLSIAITFAAIISLAVT